MLLYRTADKFLLKKRWRLWKIVDAFSDVFHAFKVCINHDVEAIEIVI